MKKGFMALSIVTTFALSGVSSVSANAIKQPPVLNQVNELKKEVYIISFNEGFDKKTFEKNGGQILYEFKNIPAATVLLPQKQVSVLSNYSGITYIQKEQVLESNSFITNDFRLAAQNLDWGIEATKVNKAWELGITGKDVKVAVIDTGIGKHPDIKTAGGKNFFFEYMLEEEGYTEEEIRDYGDEEIDELKDYNYDYLGHGTFIGGIINALDNDFGIKGVAPDAKLYSLPVALVDSQIMEALDWAITNDMDIVNLSIGEPVENVVMKELMNVANEKGVMLVAAAGNEGTARGNTDSVYYPAKFDSVLSVGATDLMGNRASFSSTGKVDITAPGVGIYSTFPDEDIPYTYFDGTSAATPYVVGIIALYKEVFPTMTNAQIKALLEKNALDKGMVGKDTQYGSGIIQAPLTRDITLPEVTETPKGLYVSEVADYSVSINWEPTVDATTYQLKRDGNVIYEGSSDYFYDYETTNGTHTYSLLAIGEKGKSSSISVTKQIDGLIENPIAPSIIHSTSTTTTIALNWSKAKKATSYKVVRDGKTVYEGANLSFTDTNLKADKMYTYILYAFNEKGVSDGIYKSVKTKMPILTKGPTSLKVDRGIHSFVITGNVSNPSITNINIYRNGKLIDWEKEDDDFYFITDDDDEKIVGFYYEDIQLKANTKYTYEFSYVNNSGESPKTKITYKTLIGKVYSKITSDKNIYKKGETIKLTALAQNAKEKKVTNSTFTFEITKPNGKKIKKNIKGKKGQGTYSLTKATSGTYTIKVTSHAKDYKATSITKKIKVK